jgi:hypothetical protein
MTTFVIDARGRASIEKDPDALLDYTIDWSAWLPTGDTLVNAVFSINDALASIASSAHDTTRATAWVQGGTVGVRAALRCRITTAEGRIDDRTVYLRIRER